jgi:hypothetical protein
MKKLTWFVGLTALIGVAWVSVIYVSHWNELLTNHQWVLLTWKPDVLLFLSYVSYVYISYRRFR